MRKTRVALLSIGILVVGSLSVAHAGPPRNNTPEQGCYNIIDAQVQYAPAYEQYVDDDGIAVTDDTRYRPMPGGGVLRGDLKLGAPDCRTATYVVKIYASSSYLDKRNERILLEEYAVAGRGEEILKDDADYSKTGLNFHDGNHIVLTTLVNDDRYTPSLDPEQACVGVQFEVRDRTGATVDVSSDNGVIDECMKDLAGGKVYAG